MKSKFLENRDVCGAIAQSIVWKQTESQALTDHCIFPSTYSTSSILDLDHADSNDTLTDVTPIACCHNCGEHRCGIQEKAWAIAWIYVRSVAAILMCYCRMVLGRSKGSCFVWKAVSPRLWDLVSRLWQLHQPANLLMRRVISA